MFSRTTGIPYHPISSSVIFMFTPPQRLLPSQLHTTGCLAAAELQPDPAEELSPASPEIYINFCHSELDSTEQQSQAQKEHLTAALCCA